VAAEVDVGDGVAAAAFDIKFDVIAFKIALEPKGGFDLSKLFLLNRRSYDRFSKSLSGSYSGIYQAFRAIIAIPSLAVALDGLEQQQHPSAKRPK
jgi:hypothetical protein